MISLHDKIWQQLYGGYKIPYDVSIPLRELENLTDSEKEEEIYKELWEELHHQGDVGLASYLALPQTCKNRYSQKKFNCDILDICTTIEQQRHLGDNPTL